MHNRTQEPVALSLEELIIRGDAAMAASREIIQQLRSNVAITYDLQEQFRRSHLPRGSSDGASGHET
jgi:hypothetical protein